MFFFLCSELLSCPPSKLLCFTQSSALVHKLPVTYPEGEGSPADSSLLSRLVYTKPDEVIVCRLASLQTQSSVQELLKEFTNPGTVSTKEKRVLVIVADMQDSSKRIINHLRLLVEKAERECNGKNKLFVLLLHFPPVVSSEACYPFLFLRGWNHYYLNTIGYDSHDDIVSISDWLQLCCFGPDSQPSIQEALFNGIHKILRSPGAVSETASWTPFFKRVNGSFSKPMTPEGRRQAIKELFESYGIGEVICKHFQTYWEPEVMLEYLQMAASVTYNQKSTLSVTNLLATDFKKKFFEFLVYIVAKMNEDFNIDIIFGEQTTHEVITLFVDILKTIPLPNFAQLRPLCTTIQLQEQDETLEQSTTFPFFRLISTKMDEIVEQSRRKENQRINWKMLSDETGNYNRNAFFSRVCENVKAKIKECGMVSI